jgi:hypothetical protein
VRDETSGYNARSMAGEMARRRNLRPALPNHWNAALRKEGKESDHESYVSYIDSAGFFDCVFQLKWTVMLLLGGQNG